MIHRTVNFWSKACFNGDGGGGGGGGGGGLFSGTAATNTPSITSVSVDKATGNRSVTNSAGATTTFHGDGVTQTVSYGGAGANANASGSPTPAPAPAPPPAPVTVPKAQAVIPKAPPLGPLTTAPAVVAPQEKKAATAPVAGPPLGTLNTAPANVGTTKGYTNMNPPAGPPLGYANTAPGRVAPSPTPQVSYSSPAPGRAPPSGNSPSAAAMGANQDAYYGNDGLFSGDPGGGGGGGGWGAPDAPFGAASPAYGGIGTPPSGQPRSAASMGVNSDYTYGSTWSAPTPQQTSAAAMGVNSDENYGGAYTPQNPAVAVRSTPVDPSHVANERSRQAAEAQSMVNNVFLDLNYDQIQATNKILDLISLDAGPPSLGSKVYDMENPGKYTPGLSSQTAKEWMATTNAKGFLQVIPSTLKASLNRLGLSEDVVMSPQVQQVVAMDLVQMRANQAVDKTTGRVDPAAFARALADEWAAFELPSGKSAHAGIQGNVAYVPHLDVVNAAQSLVATDTVVANRNFAEGRNLSSTSVATGSPAAAAGREVTASIDLGNGYHQVTYSDGTVKTVESSNAPAVGDKVPGTSQTTNIPYSYDMSQEEFDALPVGPPSVGGQVGNFIYNAIGTTAETLGLGGLFNSAVDRMAVGSDGERGGVTPRNSDGAGDSKDTLLQNNANATADSSAPAPAVTTDPNEDWLHEYLDWDSGLPRPAEVWKSRQLSGASS